MKFYLGTDNTTWLSRTSVPLFISRCRLIMSQTWHRATGPWALDSGAFSELNLRHCWTVPARQYAAEAKVWSELISPPDFAAIQDWMCEPFMLDKTGLSVAEHQRRTVKSYLDLMSLAPAVPWLPVLQGFTRKEYLSHVDQYRREGIKIESLPLVGLGSVCRRQGTKEIKELVEILHQAGITLHGFGVKQDGLVQFHQHLHSSDSMAWCYNAWREKSPLPGCKHRNCCHCIKYAMRWRRKLLGLIGGDHEEKTPKG